jgi:transaldolase
MKFFINTPNIVEIKKAWELGVIDGVTTNPFLISWVIISQRSLILL